MDYYFWAASRCSIQEYSRTDILTKLKNKGASAEEAEAVVEKLEKEGFLNESRYAAAFVSDKYRFDGWGRIKIRFALRQKGVAEQLIGKAMDEIDDAQYRQKLKDFINAKRRNVKGDSDYAIRQKIARSAINRGFEPALVFDLLNREEDSEF